MEPFTRVRGLVAPLDRANIDTDQIIPAAHLKRVERTGFGQFLFERWRLAAGGKPDPAFVLNQPGYAGATILVTGTNFGCGSSREHAVWALQDYGFRAVIAPSFADIFRSNAYQNGLLPVALPEDVVRRFLAEALAEPGFQLTVDLERCTVADDDGFNVGFEIDAFRREALLGGLDEIALTLTREAEIAAYEARRDGGT